MGRGGVKEPSIRFTYARHRSLSNVSSIGLNFPCSLFSLSCIAKGVSVKLCFEQKLRHGRGGTNWKYDMIKP